MNGLRHFDSEQLALFAMQLLTPAESSAVATHIEQCMECRLELASIQGDLAIYAHTVDLHSPPAFARERLMQQVAREKKAAPLPASSQPVASSRATFGFPAAAASPAPASPANGTPRAPQLAAVPAAESQLRRMPEPIFRSGIYGLNEEGESESPVGIHPLRRITPWLGWAAAAGLAVASLHYYSATVALQSTVRNEAKQLAVLTDTAANARQAIDVLSDPTALQVTLKQPRATAAPQGRATYVASRGALIFVASNLKPLEPLKTYELWLIPANGHDPIPAGTFHPDARGNASVVMPELPKGIEAKAFGVTIEDEGGATTPTLPIILAGA
ncbi:MAG: anti-sigma factor [Acidobacteriota bacterium]|nr:anti-sigma factor [Acidobacteriota bacterium]